MSVAVDQALSQAYEYIEAGRPEDAEALLQPLLMSERNNPDFWWVYAHAVTDAETAREALRSVLKINSAYPDAAKLMAELEEAYPRIPLKPIKPISLPSSDYADLFSASSSNNEPSFLRDTPSPPSFSHELLPDVNDDDPDFDTLEIDDNVDVDARRSTPLVIGLTVIGVIIILGFLALTFLNAPKPEVAVNPTVMQAPTVSITVIAPTDIAPIEPTEVPVIESRPPVALIEAQNSLRATLTNLTFPPNELIKVEPTNLGRTWVVEVCGSAGPERRSTLVEVMEAAASKSVDLAGEIDAIGVRIINCERNDILITVASSMNDAAAFASGGINSESYQALWRPQ